jgi:peptidoglycan/xylan/chitin deacetylase (PgdA/CDA1 family)
MRAAKDARRRDVLRAMAFLALRLTLLPTAIRTVFQSRKVTIIAYHAPSPEAFGAHVRALRSIYNLVSLSDYVEASQSGNLGKLPRRALILTIDDGHRSNYALKDVIAKYKIPVTIFVCSGLVATCRRFWFLHEPTSASVQELKRVPDADRLATLRESGFEETKEFGERQALSAYELDELKTTIDFQSHTVLHPILPRCSSERAETEITKSREDLQGMLGTEVYALAYPNGDYSERELRLVEKAGYKCALGLDPGFNSATTSPFRLRRFCIPDHASQHELIVKTSGLWHGLLAVLESVRRRGPVGRSEEKCERTVQPPVQDSRCSLARYQRCEKA